MSNVIEMTHPLIQHKITRLRDKNTGTAEFSSLVEEIAMLMGYEALKDLPLEEIEIETPIETCKSPVIAGKKLAIVPILSRTRYGKRFAGTGTNGKDRTYRSVP